MNNNNSVYNDYYKAIKRDESSVVLNNYLHSHQIDCNHSVRNDSLIMVAQDSDDPLHHIPTTSKAMSSNHVHLAQRPRTLETGQPVVMITTPNGGEHHHYIRPEHSPQQQQQIPVKKSSIEVVMSSPLDRRQSLGRPTLNSYQNQYYTRVIANQSDAEEKYYYNQFERQYEICNTPAELEKSLRWIHWRMTLFVFYWIVWFIGLILVIIIVAYRAKV